MRRQLNLMEYALHSLNRRWKKNLSLLLVYTLVVGLFASLVFLSGSLRQEANQVLSVAPQVWVQKIAGGRLQPISVHLADSIRSIRGIRSVEPRVWGYYYDAPTDAVFTIVSSQKTFPGLNISVLQKEEAFCGSGFAELHQMQPGQRILLLDPHANLHGFKLVDSFDPETDILTRDLIVLHPEAAATLLGLPAEQATDLAVYVTNNDESANIATKISRMIPGVRVVTRDQLQRTYDRLFGWKGGVFMFGAILSLLAFLILAWDKASGLSAEEKKELGILKGIGWQIQDVLWLKFWESFSLSISATLLGLLAGFIHIYFLDATVLKSLFSGWSTLYPNYKLIPAFTLNELIIILTISVFPYLTATIIPAWRGAITDPAEIMQNN